MNADLLYSDTEEALRDSVRHLLADRCPREAIAALYDVGPQDFSGVWKELAADLGLAGLLVPEQLGGAGASAREAAVVMEEIGRAVAPVPFLSSAVLATVALLRAGETETLAALATGAVTAALVMPLSTAPGDPVTGVSIGTNGLTGRVSSVAERTQPTCWWCQSLARTDSNCTPSPGPQVVSTCRQCWRWI